MTSTALELARRLDIPTPTLDAVAALARMYEIKPEIEEVIFRRQ